MTDHSIPGWANKARRRAQVAWTREDRRQLTDLWYQRPPLSIERIAEIMGREATAVYAKARAMGFPGRREIGGGKRRGRRKAKHGGSLRRFAGVQNSAGPKIILEPHDPRSRAGITVFPTTVLPAAQMPRLLKSGHNSRKIGKQVAKGRLKGAPIFTLTLEERATCPRSCEQWANCYGNNMHFAQRISDDGTLIRRLWGELAALNAEFPKGFLIRLHVLGDFYSPEYVRFWRQALEEFPGLWIFGFTARRPPDPIGIEIVALARDFYDRFRMRFSGLREPEDGAIVIDRREDAIGIICPAEGDPDRCCATCGLCWHSNRSISFMRH